MLRYTATALKMALITLMIFGLIYPLMITGIARIVFPRQLQGSLIRNGEKTIGSELIGQSFTRPEYFHPRPSAAGKGYDASASGGSNLGPTSKKLASRVRMDVDQALTENPGLKKGQIPSDMVTTSGSGLDPDISPANAEAQIPRVARARGMSETELRKIVQQNITQKQFGMLGESHVNVLMLNRTLDSMERSGRG